MIVDHDNRRVLEVLENRDKASVLAYLRQAKEGGLLAAVEEVTTDMWDGYVEAAREAFGERVVVTIDRFHVMKNFQECLTGARRELQRQLPEADRGELKGSRWLWVTNPIFPRWTLPGASAATPATELTTRRNSCNDIPLKTAAGSRPLAA